MLETVEEVFDHQTLMSLYEVIRRGYISKLYGVVSSGKEARIYWGKSNGGEEVAVKIYYTSTSEFKKNIRMYIEGDVRFEGLARGDHRRIIYLWARKEYSNLKRMYEVGVRVPKPIFQYRNILVMEFIGWNGRRAPLLREVELGEDEAMRIFNTLIEYVEKLYNKAKLVHADLSEYNVMVYEGEPVIIDVSQAVHVEHPMATYFLRRDLRNISRYFREEVGLNVPSVEELLSRVVGWESIPTT